MSGYVFLRRKGIRCPILVISANSRFSIATDTPRIAQCDPPRPDRLRAALICTYGEGASTRTGAGKARNGVDAGEADRRWTSSDVESIAGAGAGVQAAEKPDANRSPLANVMQILHMNH